MEVRDLLRNQNIDQTDLLNFLRQQLNPDDGDVIFIGGSLAEGLGTTHSDIDIFFIKACPHPNSKPYQNYTLAFNNLPLDIEIKPRNYVTTLIDNITHLELTTLRSAFTIFRNEIDFANNLHYGIPLLGQTIFWQWHQRLPWSRLSKRLLLRLLADENSLQCDLCGFLLEDDFHSAILISLKLVTAVAQYANASLGRTTTNEKWAIRALRHEALTHPEYKGVLEFLVMALTHVGSSDPITITALAASSNAVIFLIQLYTCGHINRSTFAQLIALVSNAFRKRFSGGYLLPGIVFRYDGLVCSVQSWPSGVELRGNWMMGLAGLLIAAGAKSEEIAASIASTASAEAVAKAIADLNEVIRTLYTTSH